MCADDIVDLSKAKGSLGNTYKKNLETNLFYRRINETNN